MTLTEAIAEVKQCVRIENGVWTSDEISDEAERAIHIAIASGKMIAVEEAAPKPQPKPTTNGASAQPLEGMRMSDDPVCDHCGVGGPTFTAADLEAAFRLGLEMAEKAALRREISCAEWVLSGRGTPVASEECIALAFIISDLTPPPDLAERVKSQGEEFAKKKRGGDG